jgi:AcrR family transcriptional regulator
LYNYFDSKEAIFKALLEHRCEELAGRLAPISAGAGGPRDKLGRLTRTMFEYVESHGAMLTLILEAGGSACSAREGAGPGASRQYLRTLAIYRDTLAQAAEQGILRAGLDVGELAAAMAGAMGGMVRRWLMGGRRGRLGDRADLLVELFFRGAEARP